MQIHKFSKAFSHGSNIEFGAEIKGLDLENLSGKYPQRRASRQQLSSHVEESDFTVLRRALYENQVVLIRGQQDLSPAAQYKLTKRFDPEANTYSHGSNKLDTRSVLHSDLKTIPSAPQVQVIGSGHIASYEGLENITLKHPHHRTFHEKVIPKEEDLTHTHFYRWHIDSAMYDLDPPLMTTLLAIKVPKTRTQTLRYDDGSSHEITVPLGTTAFFSGYTLFNSLSPEDKEFVKSTYVEYAPHPYIWMSKAKSRPNGLGLLSQDLELSDQQLPPIDPSKIKKYPMVWMNPVTKALALMVYPTAARRLHLKDGTVVEDLRRVREVLYQLQRPGIEPGFVYMHDWVEGDLVLFNNHGVMHSVVGAFERKEVRIFRQCNMAASRAPVGPDGVVEEM